MKKIEKHILNLRNSYSNGNAFISACMDETGVGDMLVQGKKYELTSMATHLLIRFLESDSSFLGYALYVLCLHTLEKYRLGAQDATDITEYSSKLGNLFERIYGDEKGENHEMH